MGWPGCAGWNAPGYSLIGIGNWRSEYYPDSPDTKAKLKNVGFEGFSSTPEELAAFMKTQLRRVGEDGQGRRHQAELRPIASPID